MPPSLILIPDIPDIPDIPAIGILLLVPWAPTKWGLVPLAAAGQGYRGRGSVARSVGQRPPGGDDPTNI